MRNSNSGSIDGRPVSGVAVRQLLTKEAEVDVCIDQPQQVVCWNLIFHTEVVEQRLIQLTLNFSKAGL
jgi:hypothetical protein